MEINILPSECACKDCFQMCHAPCCGTPDDMQALIDAGYGDRLMYDDWHYGEKLLKLVLKGCNFWKADKKEWEF